MGRNDWFEIEEFEVQHETPKAVLLTVEGEEMWIPKSQMRDPDDFSKIEIRHWLAVTNNLTWEEEEEEGDWWDNRPW